MSWPDSLDLTQGPGGSYWEVLHSCFCSQDQNKLILRCVGPAWGTVPDLQVQPQAMGFHPGINRGGMGEANFPSSWPLYFLFRIKKMLPCKVRRWGVALWHLEVGVQFQLKIKPQEVQSKRWIPPFWKHENLHCRFSNPCSINSLWPGRYPASKYHEGLTKFRWTVLSRHPGQVKTSMDGIL